MTNTVLKWLLLVLLTGYTAWVTVWANREARRHECTGITVNVLGSETQIFSNAQEAVSRRNLPGILNR